MTAYLLTNHLINLLAPAAFVALLTALLARSTSWFYKQKRAVAQPLLAHLAIVFIANLLVLVAGLVVWGQDAKMATYAAMALASGLSQWLLRRQR